MPVQQPVQSSRARRWAYGCGMSIKRGCRRLKAFECRMAEHAVTAGMPAGNLIVRRSFLVAKLTMVGVFLFVNFWALLSLTGFIVLYLVISNYRLNDPKDLYEAQAYGDPYGEYELNRVPGQPDLDDH